MSISKIIDSTLPLAWIVSDKVYDNQADANNNSAYHSNFKDVIPLYTPNSLPILIEEYQNKINHLKQLLRNVRTTLHFTPEDVLAIDAALREDEE